MNPVLSYGYAGGNEKKQVSLSDERSKCQQPKNKLVDFAVVSG
jgi:hypothetical protein